MKEYQESENDGVNGAARATCDDPGPSGSRSDWNLLSAQFWTTESRFGHIQAPSGHLYLLWALFHVDCDAVLSLPEPF